MVAFGVLLLSSCTHKKAYTVKLVNNQVAMKTPAAYSQYAWHGSSSVELTRARVTPKGTTSEAHIVVFTEKRRDYKDAVERLGDIASETKVRPTFLLIDGWPALQRRQTIVVPPPGGSDKEGASTKAEVVQITTAIAANDIVVRSEASVPVGADSSVIAELEKMGRSFTFVARPNASESKKLVEQLSRREESPPVAPVHPEARPLIKADRKSTPPGAPSAAGGGPFGELEVAASTDGMHVVVAAQNATTFFSDDGGLSFKMSAAPTLPPMIGTNLGDPSIARGASGTFYASFLSQPGGACASSVMNSAPNNGLAFTFAGNAVLCPSTGDPKCFPDQEHIAADPKSSSTGTDQIYLVYRHYTPSVGGNCPRSSASYPPFPSITCSADNGKTWLPPAPIAAGDWPRVTVGNDGFVWVVQRSYEVLTVSKFSSCETGLQAQPGFPRKVISVFDPVCPVAGLDRCSGASLSSATIAVDQTNPAHLYIAYANSTASTNDDIVVIDSADAFATSPNNLRQVTVSGAPVGRRYMPWLCTLGSSAQVTWYDRRAGARPGASGIDLTDFFRGNASVVTTLLADGTTMQNLVSGAEVNVSGVSDAQCAPGFPCGERDPSAANLCPRPHNDGACRNGAGVASISCDQDTQVCPAGQSCVANGVPPNFGCPKYGDYNGATCAAGHVFAAWASATTQLKTPVTVPGGIGLFVDALNCGGTGQACCSSGNACHAGLNCDGTSNVCGSPACGGIGQPCCADKSCGAGSGCSENKCVACPPLSRTLVDTTVHNGADCGGTSHDFDLGATTCDPGFVLGTCSADLISENNGSTCDPIRLAGCKCRVTVTTPRDCTKWATCRAIVTEKPAGATLPEGCPVLP
jgi:hypothetical protein